MHRDVPDAEKAQHVVNSVGVEVFSHLLETSNPPSIAFLSHCLPIVGGESPVLPVLREVVRRCTCLSIQIEKMRFRPGFHTVARNADGDVTLDDDPVLPSLISDFQQLQMQQILYIVEKRHLLISLATFGNEFFHLFLVVFAILRPFPELRRLVFIP